MMMDRWCLELKYNVLHEDGDAEDMNEEECRSVIDLYMKLESGGITEWEIGGDEWLDHSFVCLFILWPNVCSLVYDETYNLYPIH